MRDDDVLGSGTKEARKSSRHTASRALSFDIDLLLDLSDAPYA